MSAEWAVTSWRGRVSKVGGDLMKGACQQSGRWPHGGGVAAKWAVTSVRCLCVCVCLPIDRQTTEPMH